MTSAHDELLAADAWGIHHHWVDARHRTSAVPADTVLRLREAIGTPPADLDDTAPIVSRPGSELGLGRVDVDCEDGRTRAITDALPHDFPLGYHRLRTPGGHQRLLIVSPGRCWLPPDWRAWGWTVQLYAARSRSSWEVGDLGDLRAIRTWAEGLGADFLLVNPLHAVAPTLPQEASPYLPATRRFRNPLYLRVEDVPGSDAVDLARWASSATAYDERAPLDRDRAWTLKRDALAAIFDATGGDEAFAVWRTAQGGALEEFATWCVLAEVHGPNWREWPVGLQIPVGGEVATFVTDHAHRVDFYCWLQWLLDGQLQAASGDINVIQDLPIGVDGGGADAWAWQDTLATGVRIGAPPDIFNPTGQDWGSPPLTPWRLRSADYEPFIASIRATMQSAGGIRIDHVMGLFRLWWVPQDASPADGAYVRYPSADLLDIVALESHRARSLVVGEDLGTVEPGVREALADHAILSYRLLWFEDEDPDRWPESSMGAITTHDLPTIAGLWTGDDVREQAAYSDAPADELERGRQSLLARWVEPSELEPSATVPEAVIAAHRMLSRSPSLLLSATLEDAVAEGRRPNIPGATTRGNWCVPLPVHVDDLPSHPTAQAVAGVLRNAVSGDRPTNG
ncbi:MAG: 4-alpha-glucanotransferase [Nocardioidaceae bacterium]